MDSIKKALTILLCVLPLVIIFMFAAVFFLTKPALISSFTLSDTGQIGDTIGGISVPIIGLFGVSLTFLAFWVQYTANKVHTEQFDKQSTQQEADKHREKILYLIKQNRSIAKNMKVQGHTGARCFKKMFDEYQFTYIFIKDHCEKKLKPEKTNLEISNQDIINAAYMIFYNGVGPSSNALNKEVLKDFPYYSWAIEIFTEINQSRTNGQLSFPNKIAEDLSVRNLRKIYYPLQKLGYIPFEGHVNRLGQYFRNLFHILDYTSKVDEKYLTDEDKYELIKSLRSQLSNFEQILIHFNSLSRYGDPVRSNGYISTYKLVKNIPLPLIGFAGNIKDFYVDKKGKAIFEFEWDQILSRVNTDEATRS